MKKTVVMTLLLLLTSVWSMLFAGLQDKQPSMVIPPMDIPLCSPAVVPIDQYLFAFPVTDTVVKLPLESYDMLLCATQSANLLLLPPSVTSEPISATICSGESYTWNGNTYTKPGTYTDTLQNIYGCDSIVTLNLEVLPDPPITFTVNGVSFKMMRVRAGSFIMGALDDDTEAEANERPAHLVTLTRDYFVSETVLTQELWTAVMGTTIQEEEAKGTGEKNLGYGPNFPMYCLSHNDCLKFVEQLNQLTGITFRMPTEAEWEYAARGGHLSRGYKYPGSNDPLEVAWSIENDPQKKLHPVKLLKPNELGLYDMAGNVWEYIYDFRRTYTAEPQVNPLGDISGNQANIRGGSTAWGTTCSRTSYRHQQSNITKDSKSGRRAFRFVLDADRVIGEDNTTYQDYDTICAGDTYTWEGDTYTESGAYTKTLQNIYGCDSIVTLHLQVNPTYEIQETVVACDSYFFNPFNEIGGGITLWQSGTYKDTAATANGCDSIVTLHLTIMPEAITTTETVVIGSDALPYIWRGQSLTATGLYTDIEQYMAVACDSAIHVLNLTVLTTGATDEQTVTICDTELPYQWYNQDYSTTGTYTHIEKYVGTDIDSVQHVLHLTVTPTIRTEETVTACDSYAWNGQTYDQTGDYTYTTTAANGCDSIVTLHLTINQSEVGTTDYATICHGETYTWNGQTYSAEGEYSVTLTNQEGCDSTATLCLTILPAAVTETESVTVGSDQLPYTWRGQSLNATGQYTDIEQYMAVACDSAIHVLDLTVLSTGATDEQTVTICDTELPYQWYNQDYSTTGTYTHIEKYVGTDIDSVQHVLHLTVTPTIRTE
ncbi:MAG: SUMF1/EgtB/PvdO family nonheme iron enzyme, partial [Paludibacteraceae bacterium]|nr:SUMF1/EgtB/PvdO family nonheme iron enzyme [Paludibacteraceae bacterium]